ncbi:uncharacterized protein LOC134258285 [Saccostrea cucullata]|uniref:uncharacterized protein LOC134258285 n=1 Tax=Saccostrea cuccullata TaxID=36930 RepID=UPI002ED07963
MATGRIGRIDVFDPAIETWTAYEKRLDNFFTANTVDDNKKVPALLSLVGPKTYALLRDLTASELPKARTYKQLTKALKEHYSPRPLVIVERFRFHKRDQQEGESVREYIAALRKLSEFCEFKDVLNDTLRDRFETPFHYARCPQAKDDIEQELKTLDTEESFLQSHTLEILEGNVEVTPYIGQGDKLYPGHLINDSETKAKSDTASSNSEDANSNIQYGTLGAFLEEITSKGLYGITCRHVIPHENEKVFMEIQKNDLPSEVGQSVYTSENEWEDFAVFEVKDFLIDQCIKTFHNDDDEECNVEVHQGNDLDNWIVHKKGARTGWTTGRILSRECYSSLIPVKHGVFLVGGFDEDYFARTGDSGSVVFMRKSSQSTVSVLGMVFGGMENIYNDHQPEIEKSTMCFLLNHALSNLSVQNGLELQFVPRKQSSSDSD